MVAPQELTLSPLADGPSSGNVTVKYMPITGPLGVFVRKFGDHRGFFMETYSQRDFEAVGITAKFVQDNHSLSATVGTLRGMHFQLAPQAQSKLVRVLKGAIIDIAVDLRHNSPTFGQHISMYLSATGGEQIFVPAGFAHGFCTLEPDTEVAYKVDAYYAPELDRGLAWDDPDLALPWPTLAGGPVLSDKDKHHPRLRDLPPAF